jgi:hypothetical protein
MAKSNGTQIILQQPQALRFQMPRTSNGVFESVNDPNQWFADKFPQQTEQFGPAFLAGTWTDADSLTHFIPAYLNEDFFAAILGGDKHLGHQVVYFRPENTFYFFDYRVDAFCPTTEEKLKLLLSNYLVRCSQECGFLVDITNLVVKFRQDDALSSIITKAKAILEADRLFFQGKDGRRRYIDGKYTEPNEKPSYELFVNKALVREPQSKITVADAFHRYYQFCRDSGMKPLTRTEFRGLVAEVIREEFNIGLRHDVVDDRGKMQHGWYGLDCRMEFSAN